MPVCVRCEVERQPHRFRPRSRICRNCYQLAVLPRRLKARRFVAKVRARVPCADCGEKGKIEWHNEAHIENPSMRVGNLAGGGWSIRRIVLEMRASTPLCRRCHMRRDGRAAQLTASRPYKLGDAQPPKPCLRCQRPYKPLRRGLCTNCYKRHRAKYPLAS